MHPLWIVRTYILLQSVHVGSEQFSRTETVVEIGTSVNFTWIFVNKHDQKNWNKESVAEYCGSQDSQLPLTYELRYFYKSMLMSRQNLGNKTGARNENVTFYLHEVVDTTADFPNFIIGERMCIVMKTRLGDRIHYAETDGRKSCSFQVNTIVCRRELLWATATVPQIVLSERPFWPEEAKTDNCQEPLQSTSETVCIERGNFYIGIGLALVVLLGILCCVFWIIYKYAQLKRASSRISTKNYFKGNYLSPLHKTDILNGGLPDGISSFADISANIVSNARYDILTDALPSHHDSMRTVTNSSSRSKPEQSSMKFRDVGKAEVCKKQKQDEEILIDQKCADDMSSGFL